MYDWYSEAYSKALTYIVKNVGSKEAYNAAKKGYDYTINEAIEYAQARGDYQFIKQINVEMREHVQ